VILAGEKRFDRREGERWKRRFRSGKERVDRRVSFVFLKKKSNKTASKRKAKRRAVDFFRYFSSFRRKLRDSVRESPERNPF